MRTSNATKNNVQSIPTLKIPSISQSLHSESINDCCAFYSVYEGSTSSDSGSLQTNFATCSVVNSRRKAIEYYQRRLKVLLSEQSKVDISTIDLRIELILYKGSRRFRFCIESYSKPFYATGRIMEKRIFNKRGLVI